MFKTVTFLILLHFWTKSFFTMTSIFIFGRFFMVSAKCVVQVVKVGGLSLLLQLQAHQLSSRCTTLTPNMHVYNDTEYYNFCRNLGF